MPPKKSVAAKKEMSVEEQARKNPERFIQVRFPDPEKSPDTMLLCGLSEATRTALQDVVANVPGLDARFFAVNDMLAIGWYKKAVWNGKTAKARTPVKAGTPAKTRGRPKKTQDDPTPVQVTPVKAQGNKRKSATAAAASPADSKRQKKATPIRSSILGSYEVTCPYFVEQWPDSCSNGLGLHISATDLNGVYVGEFDFGIMEGVMLISTDKDVISRYGHQIDKDNSYHRAKYGRGYDDEDDDEDDEEDEDDDAHPIGTTMSGKKGTKTTAAVKAGAPPLKYHVCCRGRETYQEVIQSETWGEIMFTNSTFKKFAGEIQFALSSSNCKITANKTLDNKSSISSSKWAEYSEEQYDYERRRRWGGRW